jgi:hypothetical protein
VHFPTLECDLAFFMGCFSVALLLGLGVPSAVRIPAALVLVFAYAGYVRWTFVTAARSRGRGRSGR